MKRLLLAAIFAVATVFGSYAEDVVSNYDGNYNYNSSANEKWRVVEIKLTHFTTYVTIEVVPTVDMKFLHCWTSEKTWLVSENAALPILGFYDKENDKYLNHTYNDKMGFSDVKAGEVYRYTMAFSGRIPSGQTVVDLVDLTKDGKGYTFSECQINNPKQSKVTKEALVNDINSHNDGICGIYEEIGGNKNTFACVKNDDSYLLFFVSCGEYKPWWFEGDIKASLTPTATAGLFKASWLTEKKILDEETYVSFNGSAMQVYTTAEEPKEKSYLKMYPTASAGVSGSSNNSGSSSQMGYWSGTGFALCNNYIATNYHVVEGASSINIYGVNGDFTTSYKAVVVATDKVNDLAILRVQDVTIPSYNIPYAVRTSTVDVGEDIFALGYPMTTEMGDEIKLTSGIINSRTGYEGNVATYQISASLQGGNSGGPIFDSDGNVIAIAVSKLMVPEATNVNYAIKASYLRNLMESSLSENVLPQTNRTKGQKLSEKVKSIKNFVYFIVCGGQVSR